MSRPLVSVMIGAFNAEPYLGEAIESVLAQTYRPLELIVVDDGSTDGTAAVAERFGDELTFAHQENGGMGASRNAAVRLAHGELYAFLDADDRFVPDKLDLQWAALERQPDLDIVFGHAREFVSPELTTAERSSVRPPAPEPMPWATPNLMLVRRESYLRVGPFSETLKVGIGVDWYARATEAGLKWVMLPDVVLERRLHLTNNGIRQADSRTQYAQVLKAALDRRRAAPGGE